MSGLMSRRKGSRVEYEVRDLIREEGFKCDRVPASGASQGFKGDLRIDLGEGKQCLVEVKARKEAFKSIYNLVFDPGLYNALGVFMRFRTKEYLIEIGTPKFLRFMLYDENRFYPYISDIFSIKHKRGLNKIQKLYELLKECQLLVIKDDRKPVLFLKIEKLNGTAGSQSIMSAA